MFSVGYYKIGADSQTESCQRINFERLHIILSQLWDGKNQNTLRVIEDMFQTHEKFKVNSTKVASQNLIRQNTPKNSNDIFRVTKEKKDKTKK